MFTVGDTRHFLFKYLEFSTNRANVAVTVTADLYRNHLIELAHNLELYLCGHPSLISVDNNKSKTTKDSPLNKLLPSSDPFLCHCILLLSVDAITTYYFIL